MNLKSFEYNDKKYNYLESQTPISHICNDLCLGSVEYNAFNKPIRILIHNLTTEETLEIMPLLLDDPLPPYDWWGWIVMAIIVVGGVTFVGLFLR